MENDDTAVKDFHYIRTEVLELKKKHKEKVLLSVHGDALDDLTLDTSAFISDGRSPSASDQPYIELFENIIFRSLRCIYQQTLTDYLTSFKAFLKDRNAALDQKGNYRYPMLEMYVRDRNIGGPGAPRKLLGDLEMLPYGYVTEPGMYETSITCPTLFESYLRRQIRHLIQNHTPVMRVRTGPRYLPIHFAIEAHALGEVAEIDGLQDLIKIIDMKMSNELQLYFDVPELGQIHDIAETRKTEAIKVPSLEFINEHFFRRQRSYGQICDAVESLSCDEKVTETHGYERDVVFRRAILAQQIKLKTDELKREFELKPLSIFNGDRIDYSLGRIRHYTKTSPAHFQNFVIFTNYQMYVEEFMKYCVAHVLVRFAHRRNELCDLPSILSDLDEGGGEISMQRLGVLAADEIEIAVPAYDKAGTGARAEKDRPFSARHLIDKDVFLIEDAAEARCNCDLENKKVRISRADLITCVKISILKILAGKRSVESAQTEKGKEDEKKLTTLATMLFRYFLQDRSEAGILGAKIPQMPAYHLKRTNHSGISMVNIGVGPSNAKTITDHISVLRPYAFLMLGHCAGLRATQELGHYVLANGYLRADGVLDDHSRVDLPIPPIGEIHDALEQAFCAITGLPLSSKTIRNGTVATTLDRNWELEYPDPDFPLERSKAIGADMESATIAANGFRYSVPYATFLCVSDRPLHGDLKLEGMADSFYRDAVAKHFRIAISAVEELCFKYSANGIETRKLRDRLQPPFQ
jgi:nucleoside phosphorylase